MKLSVTERLMPDACLPCEMQLCCPPLGGFHWGCPKDSTFVLELLCPTHDIFNTSLVPNIKKDLLKILRLPYCAQAVRRIKYDLN
jgi:hypothetical protein